MDHCKLRLETLAKYHANRIAYEEEKSKKLGRPYRLTEEDLKIFEEVYYVREEEVTDSSNRPKIYLWKFPK